MDDHRCLTWSWDGARIHQSDRKVLCCVVSLCPCPCVERKTHPCWSQRMSASRKNAAMPITYTNAKGKTYYLHQGTTKTGKPKYYFSMENEGHLAEAIPVGFEIYENPNAQVFLRKIPPKLITDEERQVVEEGMRTYADVKDYKIDVKGNVIVIYTADQDIGTLAELFKDLSPTPSANRQLMSLLRKEIQYSPMLQFLREDAQRRLFTAQRYCFRGAIDDWIDIGYGPLTTLVRRYVKHLGKESYFELL